MAKRNMKTITADSVFFFALCFSGFYLTKIIPLSPIYFAYLCSLVLTVIYLLVGGVVRLNLSSGLAFVISFFFLIELIFTEADRISSGFVGVAVTLAGILMLLIVSGAVSKERVISSCLSYINISLALIVVETTYRLLHPDYTNFIDVGIAKEKGQLFYAYKFSSIMYPDSNFVAMQLLVLYFFILEVGRMLGTAFYMRLAICSILLFLTFSRAAIIIVILFSMIYFFKKKALIFALGLFPVAIPLLTVGLQDDESLAAKVYIFHAALDYFVNAPNIDLLAGVGLGNSQIVLGAFPAHNLLLTIFIEMGLIGFLLFFVVIMLLLVYGGISATRIFMPYIIASLSFASMSAPFFPASLIALGTLQRILREEDGTRPYIGNYPGF